MSGTTETNDVQVAEAAAPLKVVRHLNSTGRGKITAEQVRVRVLPGEPRTFEADFDLAGVSGPDGAEVILEAGCAGSNTVLRFHCGTLARPELPADRSLAGLYGERVYFNAKVVDVGGRAGRLIARGLKLPPQGSGEDGGDVGGSLLPVELSDEVAPELWRVRYTQADTTLLINKDHPLLKEAVGSAPEVMPLVFPAVLREVLTEAVLSGDAFEWSELWLAAMRPHHPDAAEPPAPDADGVERREWVDQCLAGYLSDRKVDPAATYETPGR